MSENMRKPIIIRHQEGQTPTRTDPGTGSLMLDPEDREYLLVYGLLDEDGSEGYEYGFQIMTGRKEFCVFLKNLILSGDDLNHRMDLTASFVLGSYTNLMNRVSVIDFVRIMASEYQDVFDSDFDIEDYL
jgi:hypothetical protein